MKIVKPAPVFGRRSRTGAVLYYTEADYQRDGRRVKLLIALVVVLTVLMGLGVI